MNDDNDDYWERVRDIRKDDQILYDKRYTPPEENPLNHHQGQQQ